MVVAIVELTDVPDAKDRGQGVPLIVHDPRGVGMPDENGGLETLGEVLGGLPGPRFLLPQPLAFLVHRPRIEAQIAQAIRFHRQHLAESVRGNLVIIEEGIVFAGEGVGLPAHRPDSPIVITGASLRRARVHGVLGEMRQTRGAGGLLSLARADDHENGDPFPLVTHSHGVQPVSEQAAVKDVPAEADRGQITG